MTTETDPRTRTRQAIVEAAAQLLVEGGADAVTTRGVAQAAGVQAPTIYRLFGDKEGLIDAVADHVMATYVSSKASAVEAEADADPVEALRAGWHQHLEFGLANPTLFVILSNPFRGSAAAERGAGVLQERVHRVAAAGRLRVSEERAIELIRATGTGVVMTMIDGRSADLPTTAWEALAGAILTDRQASGSDDVATAIAFRTLAPTLPGLSAGERELLGEWLDRVIEVSGRAAPAARG